MAGAEETGTQRIQKTKQGIMGIRILGQIQVTPMWLNDPVCLHNVSRQESGQGRMQADPQMEIRQRSEKGGAG